MSETTPADPVAAALARIRERYCRRRLAHIQEDLYASSEDVPPLLAALEAVLEMADELEQSACNCGGSECAPRSAMALDCAASLRTIISRELPGTRHPALAEEDDSEPPRTEADCACSIGVGPDCPCEADGADGLCACCQTGGHRGSCASRALLSEEGGDG